MFWVIIVILLTVLKTIFIMMLGVLLYDMYVYDSKKHKEVKELLKKKKELERDIFNLQHKLDMLEIKLIDGEVNYEHKNKRNTD
mgnify:CR=1 FL=1